MQKVFSPIAIMGSGTAVVLKNNSGVLEVRNSADNDYDDLKVKNLHVSGTETIIDSETVSIADNVFLLNKDVTGTPSENAGIEVERGTSTNASLLFDESNDVWKAGLVGSEVEISLSTHNHNSVYLPFSGGTLTNNLYINKTQNGVTELRVVNSSTGSSAKSQIYLESDAGVGYVFKASSTFTGLEGHLVILEPLKDIIFKGGGSIESRFTSAGNLLLNKETPDHENYQFDVAGMIHSDGNIISHGASTYLAHYGVGDWHESNSESIKVYHNGSNAYIAVDSLGTGTDKDLYLQTGGTNTLQLDTDGHVTLTRGQLVSVVTTGTAPFTVASTTLVSNLNADKLDSQEGSYYLAWGNFTDKPSSSVANIDDAVSKKHSQNTDSGTTSATFGLNTGSSGVKLKDVSGELHIKNSADSEFASLNVATLTASASLGDWGLHVTADKNYLSSHLGIGTTDIEAWASGYRAIEFGGSSIFGHDSAGNISIVSNAYYDTDDSSGYKYKTTNPVAQHLLASGAHKFRVAASGTINTTISWIDALVIDTNGYVGVGVTPLYQFHANAVATNEAKTLSKFGMQSITTTTGGNTANAILASTIYSYVDSGESHTGSISGIYSDSFVNTENHQGTFAEIAGVYSRSGIYLCGAGGTITNNYGYYSRIFNNNSNGTITNSYGLYVDYSGEVGTITNKWGLHIEGSKNYFEGHVGIGTTDIESWTVGYKAIEWGSASIYAHATSTAISIASNAYVNSGYKYKTSNPAAQHLMESGVHYFRVAGSDTVDTEIQWTNALIINTSGLGIGTTPSYPIHLIHSGALSRGISAHIDSSNSISTAIRAENTSANATNYGFHSAVSGGGTDSYGYSCSVTGATNNWGLYLTADKNYLSSHLGIGTTDIEAWASGYRAIEFGGSSIFGHDSAGNIAIASNAYYSSGGYKYKTSAAAAMHLLASGAHKFRVIGSGSADGDISTWVDALVIDNSANIGIGTTTFGTSAAKVLALVNGTAPTTAPVDMTQLWSEDVGGTAGKSCLHMMAESGTDKLVVVGIQIKTDTGDPSNVHEGKMVINTNDNNVKIYADGAWRLLASW